MRNWTTLALLFALPGSVNAADASRDQPPGFETPEVRHNPIAGIYDQNWYNYRADILEAEKELGSDLRGSTDREDRWDAWDEWANELVDADKDYVKVMRKNGYRAGRVTVG